MMKIATAVGCALVFMSATGFAKDDHHECEAALDKLKGAVEQDFSSSGHHEHQQAKAAHSDGDYKKCADQASKALKHLKKDQG